MPSASGWRRAREDVQQLWEDANRAAHEAMLRTIEGGGPQPATAPVLAALFLLGVEALRRRTLSEFPDADRAAPAQRRRERFASVPAGLAKRPAPGSSAVVKQASR